jgi:hypothetical protein
LHWFKKLFKNIQVNPPVEPEIMGPQYLEALDRGFTNEVRENLMNMENSCLGYNGILVKLWKQFTKNENGLRILMDMFNKTVKGRAYPKDGKWL